MPKRADSCDFIRKNNLFNIKYQQTRLFSRDVNSTKSIVYGNLVCISLIDSISYFCHFLKFNVQPLTNTCLSGNLELDNLHPTCVDTQSESRPSKKRASGYIDTIKANFRHPPRIVAKRTRQAVWCAERSEDAKQCTQALISEKISAGDGKLPEVRILKSRQFCLDFFCSFT
jgi:hypothetical protein